MFVVDTNVLIYAADRDSPFHTPCRAQLEQWRRQASPWYLTWSIVYEFLRITTHPKVFRKPWSATDAWRFVDAVLASPTVSVLPATERHAKLLADVIAELPHLRGNIMHDAHTAVLMREHGIERIITRDTDFHRFPFVSVLDPVAA
ncbi:MAG: PIN domain-containing protein [Gammaproteobacteria bacterium]|nr:PIN domain-containing protein [Gammaproteobacteria bacterium]